MKKILLSIGTAALCFSANAQTITSVMDGNANNPLVWDCLCFPAPNDDIVIAHNITMNVDYAITSGGSIMVQANASFIEDANHRSILIDGAGSTFHNMGTTNLTNIAITSGAEVHNHGMMSLDTGLYVDNSSTFMNHHVLTQVDSILTQGTFMNEGWISAGDFYNDGGMFNSMGNFELDSFYNDGTVNHSAGGIWANAMGTDGNFTVSGTGFVMVTNDFGNIGNFTLELGRDLRVGNNFYNTDSLGGTANFNNQGLVEVMNDFYNTDELTGIGTICIGNVSSNTGTVTGTLDICDNSGTGIFDFNTGTIAGTVTDCNSGCAVGIEEATEDALQVYPNPAESELFVPDNANYVIYAISGAKQLEGTSNGSIDVSSLANGIYLIQVQQGSAVQTARFVKR